MKKVTNTTLAEARRQAADTIIGLRDGSIAPIIADAIYKQTLTIIDSYRIELRGIELVMKTDPKRNTYKEALALVASSEQQPTREG